MWGRLGCCSIILFSFKDYSSSLIVLSLTFKFQSILNWSFYIMRDWDLISFFFMWVFSFPTSFIKKKIKNLKNSLFINMNFCHFVKNQLVINLMINPGHSFPFHCCVCLCIYYQYSTINQFHTWVHI